MNEPTWITRLKSKWNITNNKDFTLIMLCFSLAGMMICVVRPIEFRLLHLNYAPLWAKVIVYPFLVIPSYYVGLVLFGLILGQFEFCRKFALNSLQRFGKLFGRFHASK